MFKRKPLILLSDSPRRFFRHTTLCKRGTYVTGDPLTPSTLLTRRHYSDGIVSKRVSVIPISVTCIIIKLTVLLEITVYQSDTIKIIHKELEIFIPFLYCRTNYRPNKPTTIDQVISLMTNKSIMFRIKRA